MTNTDDDHGAIPGEAPDTRPCVAVNVSLRMAIIEAQIALQYELQQARAGGRVAGSISSVQVTDATDSMLGISAAGSGARAPATAAERLVLLRNELAVLRARLDAPDAMLPSPHLAMAWRASRCCVRALMPRMRCCPRRIWPWRGGLSGPGIAITSSGGFPDPG